MKITVNCEWRGNNLCVVGSNIGLGRVVRYGPHYWSPWVGAHSTPLPGCKTRAAAKAALMKALGGEK